MSDSTVILCPGQGAQFVGMGKRWFEESPDAARTFGAADEIVGDRFSAKLSSLCFEGPAEAINRTDISQPAIFVTSVACFQAMFSGRDASALGCVAGLSLGEYTALHIAGAISFADAMELVLLRGRAMQEAADASRGGMVALIGADEEKAGQVCERAAGDDVLVAANFNAPGQVVLSGSLSACDRAVEVAGEMGLRATKLNVAGAFHSALMAPAAETLAGALEKTDIAPPRCTVVANTTARPYPEKGAEDAIREGLVRQLTSPVLWSQSCQWIASTFQGEYHELAPSKVLSGLMRRIDRSIKVMSHDEPGVEAKSS